MIGDTKESPEELDQHLKLADLLHSSLSEMENGYFFNVKTKEADSPFIYSKPESSKESLLSLEEFIQLLKGKAHLEHSSKAKTKEVSSELASFSQFLAQNFTKTVQESQTKLLEILSPSHLPVVSNFLNEFGNGLYETEKEILSALESLKGFLRNKRRGVLFPKELLEQFWLERSLQFEKMVQGFMDQMARDLKSAAKKRRCQRELEFDETELKGNQMINEALGLKNEWCGGKGEIVEMTEKHKNEESESALKEAECQEEGMKKEEEAKKAEGELDESKKGELEKTVKILIMQGRHHEKSQRIKEILWEIRGNFE